MNLVKLRRYIKKQKIDKRMITLANFTDKYNTELMNYGIDDLLGFNSIKLTKPYFQTVITQDDDFQSDKYKDEIYAEKEDLTKEEKTGLNSMDNQSGINKVRGRIRIRINELHRDLKDEELPWQMPQFGFNNLYGTLNIPQRGQNILIWFYNGDLTKPVYYPYDTYKVRPYMDLKEVKTLKLFDFLPIDQVYSNWSNEDFGTDKNISFNHKRYIKRFPPAWTDNDTTFLKEEDKKDEEKRVREYVDEFPRQRVQNFNDLYDPEIQKKERPSLSEKEENENPNNDEFFKFKNALKTWGSLYEDSLDNKITKENKEKFLPKRCIRKREYSPVEDEFLSEYKSDFYFTPTDKRTVQYTKISNSWNVEMGNYKFKERIIQGGRNKSKIGGISKPEEQKENWGNLKQKYTHQEAVRELEIEGQITEKQYIELSNNNFDYIVENFKRSQDINEETNKLETIFKGGFIQFGKIKNQKLQLQTRPTTYSNVFPVNENAEDGPEQEEIHKLLVTYPLRWNSKEWNSNKEDTTQNFYRIEKLTQLNPFSYNLENEYYNKNFTKLSKKIKEQKFFEQKFEIDFRSQEDVSSGDNFRWDMNGSYGYTKLGTGGDRGKEKILKKEKIGQYSDDYDGTQIKGEETQSGGTSKTQGDFLDFAVYREQTQFVHEPQRDNVSKYIYGSENTNICNEIFNKNINSEFEFDINKNIYNSIDFVLTGSGQDYEKKTATSLVKNSELGQSKEQGRDLELGENGVKSSLVEGQEDYGDLVVSTVNGELKGYKQAGEIDQPLQPKMYSDNELEGPIALPPETDNTQPEDIEDSNKQRKVCTCKYQLDTSELLQSSSTSIFGNKKNDPKKEKYIQWVKDLSVVRSPKIIDFGQDNYRKRWDLHNEFFEEWDKKVVYYDMYDIRKSRREEETIERYKKLKHKKRQVEWEKVQRFDLKHKEEKFVWANRKQIWKESGLERENDFGRQLNRHQIKTEYESYDTRNDLTIVESKLKNWYKSQNWQYMFSERQDSEIYNMAKGSSNIKKAYAFWFKTASSGKNNCEPMQNSNFPWGKGQDECLFQYRIDEKAAVVEKRVMKDQFDDVVYYYKDLYQSQSSQCTPECASPDCYGDFRRPMVRHQFSDKKDSNRTDFWEIIDKKDSWKKKPFAKGVPPVKEHTHYVSEVHKMRPNPDNKSRDEFWEGSGVSYVPTGPLKDSEKETPHYGSIYKNNKIQYYDMESWDNLKIMTQRNVVEKYNQLLSAKLTTLENEVFDFFNQGDNVPLPKKAASLVRHKIESCKGSGSSIGGGDNDEPAREDWWNEEGSVYFEDKKDVRSFYSEEKTFYRKLSKLRTNIACQDSEEVPNVKEWELKEIAKNTGDNFPYNSYGKNVNRYNTTTVEPFFVREKNNTYDLTDKLQINLKEYNYFYGNSLKTMCRNSYKTNYSKPEENYYTDGIHHYSEVPDKVMEESQYLFHSHKYELHHLKDRYFENSFMVDDKEEQNNFKYNVKIEIKSENLEYGKIHESKESKQKYYNISEYSAIAEKKDLINNKSYIQKTMKIEFTKNVTSEKNSITEFINYTSKYNTTYNKNITSTYGNINYNNTNVANFSIYNIQSDSSKSGVVQKTYIQYSEKSDCAETKSYTALNSAFWNHYLSGKTQQFDTHIVGIENGEYLVHVKGIDKISYIKMKNGNIELVSQDESITIKSLNGITTIKQKNVIIEQSESINLTQSANISLSQGEEINLSQPKVNIDNLVVTQSFTIQPELIAPYIPPPPNPDFSACPYKPSGE